jgi:tRNA ligase
VRTIVTNPPTGPDENKRHSPYAAGTSFFFKVKFDEPYMMYRDWREVTKKLLSANGDLDDVSLPKSKMHRAETRVYAKWVKGEIKRDRKQFDGYMNNHGIIRTRERFFEWMASQSGGNLIKASQDAMANVASETKTFGKTIIVPIAVPGVGAF